MSEFSAASNGSEEKTRVHGKSAPPVLDARNIFSGCVTLDPSEVDSAWSRLGANTWAMQFGEFPLVMHRAFVKTLMESKIVG